jgi:uncharacterized protein YndB with AHSA1/START domain
MDIATQLEAIDREVTRRPGPHGEEVNVRIRRTYDAAIADVWDALTDPDRMKRWFLPVTGDLRAGGTFQLEGNADGDILACEPPRLLNVTFGGPTSLVELRLSPEGEDRTTLQLEHTVPIEFAQNGAGSLFVGPGWDGGLVALDLYLRGEISDDPVAAANSPEGQELSKQSVDSWLAVVQASGTATTDEIAAATQMALAQFAPDLAGIEDDGDAGPDPLGTTSGPENHQ